MLIIGMTQVVVVGVMLSLVALIRQPDRMRWGLNAVGMGLAMLFIWSVFRWEIVSIYVRWLIPILFMGAIYSGYRRIRAPKNHPTKWAKTIGLSLQVLLIFGFAGLNWRVFRGYSLPPMAISLSSPLAQVTSKADDSDLRRFVVLHGGGSPFINAHFKVTPQNYALDILGLTSAGRHTSKGIDPADLSGYPIFGARVISPCTGVVLATESTLPDQVPPALDTSNLAGNYVLIGCQDVEVLLGHLRAGSVRVHIGDTIDVGHELCEVGNSGNSSEPHLHIHAERGGEPGVPLDGRGVPFSIDGRFLVRGSTFTK